MRKEIKFITVLDFDDGRVYQYAIEEWDIDDHSVKEFLEEKLHDTNKCHWMVHENSEIII